MQIGLIRATLIASLLFRDGLLVCSDRREVLPHGASSDAMRKVFPIGSNALYGAAGTVELHAPTSAPAVR